MRTSFALEPQTLDELLQLPPADLGRVDLARMNLLCASALPATANGWPGWSVATPRNELI